MNDPRQRFSLPLKLFANVLAIGLIGCSASPTTLSDGTGAMDTSETTTLDDCGLGLDGCEEEKDAEAEAERENDGGDEGWSGWGSSHDDLDADDWSDEREGGECFAECENLKDEWLARCEGDDDPEECEEEADEQVIACFDECDGWDWDDADDEEHGESCESACMDRMEEADAICADSENPERCHERIRRSVAACLEACGDASEDEGRPEHDGRPEYDDRPDREEPWGEHDYELSCSDRCALLREDTYAMCVEHMGDRDFCWEHASLNHEHCMSYCDGQGEE